MTPQELAGPACLRRTSKRVPGRCGPGRAGSKKRPAGPRPRFVGRKPTISLQYCNITVNDVDEAIASDDVDATFERLRAAGAEVLQEPLDQPWGPTDCAFRDPSGNTVRIAQQPVGVPAP